MKYIRTKDKIYDSSLFLREYTGWYFHEKTRLYAFIESEIITQADAIEELCDEFVIVIKNNSLIPNGYYMVEEYLLAYQSFKMDKNNELYGAIWTDKGLIYVAKMNEKGELELI